ncbi:MAG TPA: C-terminal binding protein [Bryobacteraceae bacterium]|jgi:phosphoglycerate dehydrogenase-like enzyme
MLERPLVYLIDGANSEKLDMSIEREILGDTAHIEPLLISGRDEFPDQVFDASAVILTPYPLFTAPVLNRFKKLRAVVRMGVGFDNVDIDAARALGIPVCNVPDYGTEEVADQALTLSLALVRKLQPALNTVRGGVWSWRPAAPVRRIRGQRFGIVGCGRIGTAAALRAKAFGFAVQFYDPYLARGYEKAIGAERCETLEALLSTSDVVSLHCPLSDETRGIIGAEQMQRMKPGAFLVNTARGPLITELDLLAVLRTGHLGGVALDVIENEPVHSPELLTFPNVLVTPHISFYSEESLIDLRASAARIALRSLRVESLVNIVN